MSTEVLREERECWFCDGTRKHIGKKCPSCNGTGKHDAIVRKEVDDD